MNYVIDVRDITKSFHGKTVVNRVSLKVQKGEIFGFLGPNGSGKTTTIRMICGLLTPDSGEGTCLGLDIKTQSDQIKNKVGYMTQKFSLYGDLSVRENLEFIGRLYSMKNISEKVARAIDRFEIGKARAEQLARNLSGGWKQRLALACAVLHEPELLLLDEPTAGVDPKARREFWSEIFKLSEEGVTTLVSTHYMDEAERCHHLAYLAYGNLLTFGTHAEVIQEANLQTWEISGGSIEAMNTISTLLKKMPEIEQVSAFGSRLHVSSLKTMTIEKLIQEKIQEKIQMGHQELSVRQINPSLEDVFIHYMQSQKDNFA